MDLSDEVKKYTMEKTGTRMYSRPQTMFGKTTTLPAVEVPHPGTSYNPTFEDHQALLQKACEREAKEMKKEAKIRRQLGPMTHKIPAVQKEVRTVFFCQLIQRLKLTGRLVGGLDDGDVPRAGRRRG